MPTTNPRITITLKPEIHVLLRRLSELSGQSQSSMVSELLDQSSPVFGRMVQVLEAAHVLKEKAQLNRAAITEGMESAQRELEVQLGIALETMDEGFRPVFEAAGLDSPSLVAGAVGRARSARSAADGAQTDVSTPMSNRGVTPHQTGQGKANNRRRQGGQ